MITNNKKAELLSPASTFESVRAAFNAGADAVYIGGQKFGARAYADNMNNDELLSAIDYAHLMNKKLYMTVNTLLKNQEIENQLYDYLLPYYERGLDAVIVQDMGVFNFIRQYFPFLPTMRVHRWQLQENIRLFVSKKKYRENCYCKRIIIKRN